MLGGRALRVNAFAHTIRVMQGFNQIPETPGWPVERVIRLSDRARRQYEGLAEAEGLVRADGTLPLAVRLMLPFTRWAQRSNERCLQEILDGLPADMAAKVERMASHVMGGDAVT